MIADNESVMPRLKLWIDRDRQEWFFLFFLFLAREKKDTDKIILSRIQRDDVLQLRKQMVVGEGGEKRKRERKLDFRQG